MAATISAAIHAWSRNRRRIGSTPGPYPRAAAIGKAAGNNRAMPVTVRADARATHQSVVTAMDVAAHAGYRQLNIATVNDGQ